MERSKRANRGKRMSGLIGEEAEADNEYWNQSFFQEEEEDNEFEDEEKLEDVEDSDSDVQSEDDNGEEAEEKAVAADTRKRKKNVYSDPKRKSASQPSVKRARTTSTSKKPRTPLPKYAMSVRTSTKKLSEITEAARIQKERLAEKRRKDRQRRTPARKEWTQEELLEEAKKTEVENLASLEELKKWEEEKKKKRRQRVKQSTGPQIRVRHTAKEKTISFPEGHFPDDLFGKAPPQEKQHQCPTSGKPAKYFDPVSKTWYADVDSFRTVRRARKISVVLPNKR
mmetsp:Transcript_15440/g.43754  ORF Transcript_15440/g.43754 Transcript_15440/m.43754 type:complete len:283 (+) Transcript_15440:92-940(+)